MSDIKILFLSKDDIDSLKIGLDEAIEAIETGLIATRPAESHHAFEKPFGVGLSQ